MIKLKPQIETFLQEYMKDLNGKQSAIRAGYAEKAAESQASRLLRNVKVRARLDELMEKQEKKNQIQAETILKELSLLAHTDIVNLYDKNGNLRPIHEIPEETRRAIAGIETIIDKDGNTVKKVKLWDKPRALELLGKYKKLFTDRVEHNFAEGLAERLIEARKRRNG